MRVLAFIAQGALLTAGIDSVWSREWYDRSVFFYVRGFSFFYLGGGRGLGGSGLSELVRFQQVKQWSK